MKILLALWFALGAQAALYDIPSSNRVDWTYVGTLGGAPPSTNVFKTYSSIPSAQTLQADMDTASGYFNTSNVVQEIRFSPGTSTWIISTNGQWNLWAGIHLVNVTGNPDLVQLLGGGPTIQFSDNFSAYQTPTVSSGATKGSTRIVVSSAANIFTNNYIRIYSGLDTNFMQFPGLEGGPGTNSLTQWLWVTNVSGTTIDFLPPLAWTHLYSPKMKNPYSLSVNEGFHRYGSLDSLTISNASNASGLQANIYGRFAGNYTVWNCKIPTCYGRGIQMDNGVSGLIAHNVFLNQLAPYGSSSHYFINLGQQGASTQDPPENCSLNLIYDNAFSGGRASFVVGYGSTMNVVEYNYVTNITSELTSQLPDFAFHSCQNMMNLVENNWLNYVNADFFHGSSSHNVLWRNWVKGRSANHSGSGALPNGYYDSGMFAMELDTWSAYYTAGANLIGYSGITNEVAALTSPTGVSYYERIQPDSYSFGHNLVVWLLNYNSNGGGYTMPDGHLTANTLTRHGNYDYVSNTQVFNGSDSTNLPVSFYWSSRPAWLPAGYTWGAVTMPNEGGPTINTIPAAYWFNAYGRWDGGAALVTNYPVSLSGVTISGRVIFGP